MKNDPKENIKLHTIIIKYANYLSASSSSSSTFFFFLRNQKQIKKQNKSPQLNK